MPSAAYCDLVADGKRSNALSEAASPPLDALAAAAAAMLHYYGELLIKSARLSLDHTRSRCLCLRVWPLNGVTVRPAGRWSTDRCGDEDERMRENAAGGVTRCLIDNRSPLSDHHTAMNRSL